MRHLRYILPAIVILASSCGEYSKLLKSTDYQLKMDKSKEYYEAGKYVKSTELIEQILPRYRASESGEELTWILAQSYYGMRQYEMAGSYFNSYVENFRYGKNIEEATFMSALCDYYISPRAELDQSNTRRAMEGFTVYMARYPMGTKVTEAEQYLTELRERLVEKSYLSARLYYDMKQYKAAVTALSNSLKAFADSKYREEMMFLKLSSLYMYAENSYAVFQKERFQNTLDDYYSFMEEFPESRYAKNVRKIYEDTAGFLKIDVNDPQPNTQ
ncbi:MAG TPA: outer membrane protein assembly factor BamD [Bacteroidales bacterium]|nr:outer membrane protein assembly factor BamD [Bacteroidales bacterium]HPJ58488.1 outer membrane protein assembly factor BamD [Bacteroidales bacterium]HPR11663.1 outer membrane protein assembly factor BamD [Bacteroidales bacterium]HRW85023.1 outer membrane protein assembly factor BamD [Bacteroidales bacterium]